MTHYSAHSKYVISRLALSHADICQILKPAEKKAPKYGYGAAGRRQ
jgi:hypothetical protein